MHQPDARSRTRTYDVVIIGAGVFGAWTALQLVRSGMRVAVVDAYGAGNSRATSGGESRIIRMGYGADEIYTRMSCRSLELWNDFFTTTGHPLLHRTGVLWLARETDRQMEGTIATLANAAVAFEKLSQSELQRRFPQMCFDGIAGGVYEPSSGVIMARRAVQAVFNQAVLQGAESICDRVLTPETKGRRVDFIETLSGERIAAGTFVFACGPWLPKLFPEVLGDRIFPTRQEVFFFGCPAGDPAYQMPALPAWIEAGILYGLPDLENRGMKFGSDTHGPPFDPDTDDRLIRPSSLENIRRKLGALFPALAGAPLLETRVCQYENTSNGDFLIDRHPRLHNVWFAGGGSGHGFKHGPAVGEYVGQMLEGKRAAEPRFSLASKQAVQHRRVY